MELAGALKAIFGLCALALNFFFYWRIYRSGKLRGKELQRIEDEKELAELKKRLADTLYDSIDDPNAGNRVLQKPETVVKLP